MAMCRLEQWAWLLHWQYTTGHFLRLIRNDAFIAVTTWGLWSFCAVLVGEI